MRFEWDENKREINLEKHWLDFIDAYKIFNNPLLVVKSDIENEKRFKAIWYFILENHKISVSLIYTIRNKNIRIISFRIAHSSERKMYSNKFNI